MRITAVSDTHGFHRSLSIPSGDVFVHAGDITLQGEIEVIADFVMWMKDLPHEHKVIVPGNHDLTLDIGHPRYDERATRMFELSGAHLLLGTSRTLTMGSRRVKFYGAPWVPNLSGWAFWDRNRDRYEHAPRDIDVLVTHGPPLGIRDDTVSDTHFGSRHVVRYLNQCPRLTAHIFGHVHEGYGVSQLGAILFANAATCNANYEPVNAPLVIYI